MNIKNRFAELRDKVVGLLNRAATVMENVGPHLGDEGASSLPKTFQERANTVQNEEFVVVVVGEMNRGKSMLLNAMMHKQLLAMDTLECTATVNFLRYPKLEEGQSPDDVEVHFTDERPSETVPTDKLADYTSQLPPGGEKLADLVDHVNVFVESRFLKDNVLLVDTPGTNTTTHDHIRITNEQIERSNAAIFLFDADTQGTQSDLQFLKTVEEAVSRLFFIVNKIDSIDESDVGRVLESVESKIQEIAKQSKMRPVFGVSGAKALLGRTGYVKSQVLAEGEQHKLDDSQFRKTLIEESGINAFEEDLERYLFHDHDGKGYDLLHSPISFIRSETAKIIGRLHRQIEVLDDTFDVADLEVKIEKMDRTVGDRKRQLEGMTDELSAELSEALSEAQRAFEERCGLAEAALKNELNAYDSYEALEDNWNSGAHLADLPGRSFAALERQAGKLLKDAIEGVLRKQTREIRRQVQGELGDIALDLPEMPEMVIQLQAPKIDEAEAAQLKKREQDIEDIERQLDKLDDARAGSEQRRYEELRDEKQRLQEALIEERKQLGSRPEVKVYTEIKQREVKKKGAGMGTTLGAVIGGETGFLVGGPAGAAIGAGIGGSVGYAVEKFGKESEDYEATIRDDEDRRWYDQKRESIEKSFAEKLTELNRLVKEAEGKYDDELLKRHHAEKLEELMRNEQQALEQAESKHREQEAQTQRRAMDATKRQLTGVFQRNVETLKDAVDHSVGQTGSMATDFIENVIAELDATLKDHTQELARLQSLKELKESERDTTKAGISQAIEDLNTLQEEAAHLEKEHETFVAESGEEKENV